MADHDGDETRRVPHHPASDDTTNAICGHGDSWTNYRPNRGFLPIVGSSSLISPYRDKVWTTETLKELILSGTTKVPVYLAQVTVCGLPLDIQVDLPMLVQKFIGDQLGRNPEEPEMHRGFTFVEVAAFKTKGDAWRWERFSKQNGYLPCFVSALEHKRAADENRRVMEFNPCYYKQYVFDCQPLDDCFHDVYRLLSSLYQDRFTQNMIEELRDDASIALINVWIITYSRSILHFLNVLRGYLRSNFPILIVKHPWDQDIDECIEEPANEPLLQQYTRLQYLLQFTHLARSAGSPQESSYNPCKVAAVFQDLDGVHTTATERKQFAARLQASFEADAVKFGATADMLELPPSVLDPDDPDRNKEFKGTVENLIETGKAPSSVLPLSWIFFRSAFFKTGQLYIRTSELQMYAELCNIRGDDFKKFLCEFTAFGSIIHIPDIPVFCDYVILNPTDFFYKLNELFYPRFNGDLKYGIVTLSTLKRMFGADHAFFYDVLTSCTFAAEIDSTRIEYADTEKGFPISEKCLLFPAIRTGELDEKYKKPLNSSLFLIHDQKLQPTNITVNAVKFLIENEPSLTHLTSQCLTLTQFRFHPTSQLCEESASPPDNTPVLMSMISHGDKNEIRIEGDRKGKTHVKKLIIRAYLSGIKKYKIRYKSLFCDASASTQFALSCLKDDGTMHKFKFNDENPSQQVNVCSHCDNIAEFKESWQLWREIISEEN